MKKVSLNGTWFLSRSNGKNFDNGNEWLEASIPGTVFQTMIEQKLMEDPYYRDNELDALKIAEENYCFQRKFFVDYNMFQEDKILLRFDGIDTLAAIYVNGQQVGFCNNMHCYWEFDVTEILISGENEVKVVVYSPIRYIKDENEKVYTGGVSEAMKGYPHIRKAHCMFGWDWGPRLPDLGIFRNVSVVAFSSERISDVLIRQRHEENLVKLSFQVSCESLDFGQQEWIKIIVTAPDGIVYETTIEKGLVIYQPELWWPNGLGKQPLYRVKVILMDKKQNILDVWEKRIGLRTLTVNQDSDQWGNCFAHEINGIKIFAMGADYIPEDNLLGRLSRQRTEKLLKDCRDSNFNSVRIWGGGFYPDDYFYELCDELGLLVWQDFMFACSSYELTEEFEKNISIEIVQNVRRIKNHACLALWCGNNEMETQTLDKAWKPSKKQECDYIKIFEYIIPDILRKEDPDTFYWPSSPSSGGNYDNPWDENKGDAHYWDVWHGEKPFSDYRKHWFRYLSEFGFQAFPSMKTIESFTIEKDQNIFSRIMEMHQRSAGANGKILSYLSKTYLYPKNLNELVYASQLLQAEAIRYGIEHNRRNRGRCMGTVVWQLNDIWPGPSWSGIDYFGRWKALQYWEKRAFAPVHLSCEEMGEMQQRPYCVMEPGEAEQSVRFHVANEARQTFRGVVKWSLRKPDSNIVLSGEEKVEVEPMSGLWMKKINLADYDVHCHYIAYELWQEETRISFDTCLLTMPKHFEFLDPVLTYKRKENVITVYAENFAKNVALEGIDGDVVLSDNFFDMNKGERKIRILQGNTQVFSLKSVYDIG